MSSKSAKPGRTMGINPPEGGGWLWVTTALMRSQTYRALSRGARQVLDYLMLENADDGYLDNGNLGATYTQLVAFGCTRADIARSIEEAIVAGFVDKTYQGQRVGGDNEFSRYALTFMPTAPAHANDGQMRPWRSGGVKAHILSMTPPTHRWEKVIRGLHQNGVVGVRPTRAWLKEQTEHLNRGARDRARADQKPKASAHMRAA